MSEEVIEEKDEEQLMNQFGVFYTMKLMSVSGKVLKGTTGKDFKTGVSVLTDVLAQNYPITRYYEEGLVNNSTQKEIEISKNDALFFLKDTKDTIEKRITKQKLRKKSTKKLYEMLDSLDRVIEKIEKES